MQDQDAKQIFLLEPANVAVVAVVAAREMPPHRLREIFLHTGLVMPRLDVFAVGIAL